jgi:hypothetical protein
MKIIFLRFLPIISAAVVVPPHMAEKINELCRSSDAYDYVPPYTFVYHQILNIISLFFSSFGFS